MSVGISRLSNATEKFSNLAGKISAVKSAMLNKTETEVEVEAVIEETPFVFSRPCLKDVKNRNENGAFHDDVIEELNAAPATEMAPAAIECDESILFDIETEPRTEFLNTHIKDKIMARWEIMGEEGPADDFTGEMSVQDLGEAMQETMPLLLGFQAASDYIELEYMVIADPQTGESVAPVVTVEPSEHGNAGNIYLNGKLAACVAGAQDLQASDVKLVQAKD
jgi:hypothetical protein